MRMRWLRSPLPIIALRALVTAACCLACSASYSVARRSADVAVGGEVRVLIGDSMGEMLAYYAAADLAIMGGSLLAYGSQNLIEPCAVGKPVMNRRRVADQIEAAAGIEGEQRVRSNCR